MEPEAETMKPASWLLEVVVMFSFTVQTVRKGDMAI
jgi:hypothetical protein